MQALRDGAIRIATQGPIGRLDTAASRPHVGGMKTVYSNEYIEVAVDEPRAIVRVRRLSATYPTADAAAASFDAASRSIETLERARFGLLVDLRDVAGRNDPEFERVVAPRAARTLAGFRARATLVRTAAGRLQIHRLDRENGRAPSAVFASEDEAVQHLSAPPERMTRRAP